MVYNKVTNASYGFKAPGASKDADQKVEVMFPSVDTQNPDYAAEIDLVVEQMNTIVDLALTGDLTLNVAVDPGVTKNAEMLLKLEASGADRVVTLADGFSAAEIAIPSGVTICAFLKYDGTDFLLVTSTNDGVQDGSITVSKLASNAVETAKIKDANVTAAKIATDAVESDKIKAKAVTLAKLADGNAAGDILFWNGTAWTILPKGTDGQVLKMVSGAIAWAADATE